MRSALWFAVGSVMLLSGCASLWNELIPAHPNSNFRDSDLICLKPRAAPQEKSMTFGIAQSLAGGAIDLLSKGIERESKRYSATYSARHSDHLLTKANDGKVFPRVASVVFARFTGPLPTECPAAAEMAGHDPAVLFEVEFEFHDDGVIRLVPKQVIYQRAKAKVFRWKGELDISFQVALSGIATAKDDKRTLVEFAKADFPVGKIKLAKKLEKTKNELDHLASGWFLLPIDAAKSTPGDFAPFTAMVTVIEANELGDVIGRGAKSLTDHKADLVKRVLDALEIKDD